MQIEAIIGVLSMATNPTAIGFIVGVGVLVGAAFGFREVNQWRATHIVCHCYTVQHDYAHVL